MAGLLPGDPSHHGMVESGSYRFSHDNLEEPDHSSSNWYFSRKEIEENSTSRQDGIDLKKETYFRKSYCTFLQDLGMRLKVPQVTIATAIIFCHRFFLRQSHAKNDRRTIATVCMFLAGKVEETPRPLKDVILVSYEIIHKKDPAAVQRIKQKEVYEQQKELILLGERVVLATLGFDLNVHHPYKPLVEAIKKFKVAQNALAQVAWNFVNDGLRTSLCLQFKPHHIAAGAIFLAAKFLKVKLPSDGEKVWWQEFDVTPRQLEEVSNQMLELYEQNRTMAPSHGSEVEGSVIGVATNYRNPAKTPATFEEQAPGNDYSHGAASVVGPSHAENPSHAIFREDGGDRANLAKYGSQVKHGVPSSGCLVAADQSCTENQIDPQRNTTNQSNDYGSTGLRSRVWDHKLDDVSKDRRHYDAKQQFLCANRDLENMSEASNRSMPRAEDAEWKDSGDLEGPKGYRPPDVIRKIDKDKVKAALEKRRKSRGDVVDARPIAKRADLMDEDDFIERELENGVELAAEAEKIKQERRQSWSKPLYKLEPENQSSKKEHDDVRGRNFPVTEEQSWSRKRSRSLESGDLDAGGGRGWGPEPIEDNAEEGELSFDAQEMHSPRHGIGRSHIAGSPNKVGDEKNRHGIIPQHPHSLAYQHHHHHQEPGKDMAG